MNREQAMIKINSSSPEAFLPKAKRKGFVCPNCGNGTGKDGDGIVKNPNSGKYKCFKCGIGGDVLDLIGYAYHLEDFNQKLEKGCEIFGITVGHGGGMPAPRYHTAAAVQVIEPPADLKEYFAKCRAAVSQTDFYARRGIGKELVERFGLGFDADFAEGTGSRHWKAAILPTGSDTFEARNTEVMPNDPENGRFKYRKHGKAVLWNSAALAEEREKPIFVCEGILDALSVMQAGGQAVALSSAANYLLLTKALETVSPALPLVLMLDDDPTGKEATERLAALLEEKKVPFVNGASALEGFHDANDRLLKDAEGLAKAVERLNSEAAAMPSPAELAKEEYLNTSAGHSLTGFVRNIQENAKRPRYHTGWAGLDEALGGGLFPGLYIIGAISSLGKTTLMLQMADQLAKQGRDVLFFSLEQSKYELMSKSISRESYLYTLRSDLQESCALMSRTVLDGRIWENFTAQQRACLNGAMEQYEAYAKHIFIHEGIGNISVEEIKEKLRAHISITGNKHPVVMIDYLQILKASDGDERATEKQIVDHNVTALKQLSRDFDLPVFAVSSLNRMNYSSVINMASFKESGAIEYGSDVLLGLQLTGSGEDGFDVTKAKAKQPREIDFCILKNRSGKITEKGIPLLYDTRFNLFTEAETPEEEEYEGNGGGWRELTKEEEDKCPF